MRCKNGWLFLLILSLYQNIFAQDIPGDMRPFVRLERSVNVLTFDNPIIDQESNRVIKAGQLIKQETINVPLGSGTIISSDGLILTNYHVYKMENKFRYDEQSNRLHIIKSSDSCVLVYGLADNDPLKAPVLQYTAEPVSLDKEHDTALLKIVSNGNGVDLKEKNFPFIPVGNPFSIKLNQELLILGYPSKGGNTITITGGKFLGYYLNKQFMGRDGFIKTNAAMSPGNSGGAALHQLRIVGLPTAVTLPTLAGSDMGYIYPITWAAKVLTVAQRKYDLSVPELPMQWFQSDYNTDETARNVYITGKFISANSRDFLPATLIVARPDRTFDQIRQIHEEIQGAFAVFMIKQMHKAGASVEDIAAYFGIQAEKVREIVNRTLSLKNLHPDVQSILAGEFVYKIAKGDTDGFFITSVPRDRKLKFYVFLEGYYSLEKTIQSNSGSSQDLGVIELYQQ